MNRKLLERISQREYAARLGISNSAVSNAIRDGRIKKGWDAKLKKIIVDYADAEFGNLHQQSNRKPAVSSIPDEPIKNPSSLTLNGDSTYAEAKRVREILQAQIVAIELKEKKGELIHKESAQKQLFTFGQNVRISLTSIPDRVIDEILASNTRQEAHLILSTAIFNALEEITNFEIRNVHR